MNPGREIGIGSIENRRHAPKSVTVTVPKQRKKIRHAGPKEDTAVGISEKGQQTLLIKKEFRYREIKEDVMTVSYPVGVGCA
jgi:hypothetical protein